MFEKFEKEVINSEIPVIVDFYADWCVPCKMISPFLDEISKEFEGKAKVIKVDVEQAEDIANKYNIKGVPTLMLFKNGEVLEQISGAVPKNTIINMMENVI